MREVAQSGIQFARQKLSIEQRAYLGDLPLTLSSNGREFVHASLNDLGDWRYIMREPDARDHFAAQTQRLCFCGHTHVPMVWHLSNTGNIKTWRGHGRIQLPTGGKTLVNVGSAGRADGGNFRCDPAGVQGWRCCGACSSFLRASLLIRQPTAILLPRRHSNLDEALLRAVQVFVEAAAEDVADAGEVQV